MAEEQQTEQVREGEQNQEDIYPQYEEENYPEDYIPNLRNHTLDDTDEESEGIKEPEDTAEDEIKWLLGGSEGQVEKTIFNRSPTPPRRSRKLENWLEEVLTEAYEEERNEQEEIEHLTGKGEIEPDTIYTRPSTPPRRSKRLEDWMEEVMRDQEVRQAVAINFPNVYLRPSTPPRKRRKNMEEELGETGSVLPPAGGQNVTKAPDPKEFEKEFFGREKRELKNVILKRKGNIYKW